MPPKAQRTGARVGHFAAALLIGTYVYAPPSITQPLRLTLEIIGIPAATLTGLFMWRQAQVRRWLTARFRPSPQSPGR
jgi:hypothetical protein